ncbi:MAG: pyridine nucleotide-disulfide oxidoreductase, partial [Prevotellaceae bacterium]|nr:pyridine nucleotide-disulfide oxidoreductase [Prevotellaceae bacterium]
MRAVLFLAFSLLSCGLCAAELFVEAESFVQKGGWVVDPQFMDQIGSPYLMAHGMGHKVADAVTTVDFPAAGIYRMLVRSYNWTSPWKAGEGAGKFHVLVDGKPVDKIFGSEGSAWLWQEAQVDIKGRKTQLALSDLTGFNGRCD